MDGSYKENKKTANDDILAAKALLIHKNPRINMDRQ